MTMEIKLHATERGFIRGEFADAYGDQCSIQESSLDGAFIWLGRDLAEPSRMHLSRDIAAALIPLLQRFVKNGDLSKSASDKYHDHLDKCSQCRDEPFNNCAIGAILLRATVDHP